jgi:hypothetical protein
MVSKSGFFSTFGQTMGIPGASRRWPASGHELRNVFEKFMPEQEVVQQHSGDWTMTGTVPVARVQGEGACVPFQIERMNAIPHYKTMAGSPGADRKSRSASRNLAHGFCISGVRFFREPMKEDHYV